MASGDSKVVDLQDLNPEFRRRMGNFLTSAKAAGIPAHIIEAYRDRAVQAQYYADKLAGKRRYPVAPPGTSFHEGGFAADTLADDRAQQQKLIDYAKAHPEFGIVPLAGDAPHFQIAGYKHLADALANPPALGQGQSVDLTPFIAANQGYSIAKGYTPGTTIAAASPPIAGGLAKPSVTSPYGNPFLDSLAKIESNNQNIFSGVDKDYPGQPGSRSQGYFQIDTPTWQQFAAKAGVDTVKYPSAMNAPPEVQAQVAQLIPFSRFGQRTQDMLTKQYGALDTKATIGELASKVGGGGAPATAVASAAPAVATPAAPDQPWWSKYTQAPTDKEGNPIEGAKSPVEKAISAFTGSDNMKARMEAQAPAGDGGFGQGPGARNVSPGLQNIAQTYGQTINSLMQPLTWNNAPPGNAGMRGGSQAWAAPVPGLSLNSVQAPPEGLGYGISSNYGLG